MNANRMFQFFTVVITLLSCNPADKVHTSPMNILFINDEDLSTRAVGCYGNKMVKTPYLDTLAQQGIQFNQAYCSAPMCNPSRAAFCTGLRPGSTNIHTNQDLMNEVTPSNAMGIASVLKPKGAFLANVGKLYHGREKHVRYSFFDRLDYCPIPGGYEGIANKTLEEECSGREFYYSSDSIIENELHRRKKIFIEQSKVVPSSNPNWWFDVGIPYIGMYFQVIGNSGIPEECDDDYKKVRVASQIMKECVENNQQFFLSVGISKPHTPVVAPKKYIDMYDVESIQMPRANPGADLGVPLAAKRFGAKADIFTGWFDEEFPQLKETAERQKEAIAAYYAAASFVDAQVGYLLKSLKDLEIEDNTIVIFFSDHGFHLGEHGLWSKYSLYNETTRVPLIVKVPGAKGNGKVCGEIVELVDVLPTICDLWNIEKPSYFESTSFVQLLEKPDIPWKKAAFTQFNLQGVADTNVTGYCINTKDYRFTKWGENGEHGYELYHKLQDPFEQKNLAGKEEYTTVIKDMKALLEGGWQASLPTGF
ncbi:MAG: sulfatase [Bacteroidales bacterium]|nr:sulfatase [Bacteroidales bacterium]